MRYFDRKLFVIEHLFVKHLPAGYSDCTEENTDASDRGQRNKLILKGELDELFEALELVLSDKYDMVPFFPEKVLQIAKDRSLRDKEQFYIVDWIRSCGQKFTENIEKWKSEVDENIPYLPWIKLSCFKKADPNIFPVRTKIYTDDNNTLSIIPCHNPWGEIIFQYPESDITGLELKHYDGWMLWAELERFEGFYEFSFLFNTDGSEMLSMESIMRDKNWIEFKVRCRNPRIEVSNCNYANRWSETGCQSTKIFLESCRALLAKARDIGALYLNEKERGLLYIAQLYECFSSAVNPEITGANPVDTVKLEELVNNQYGFEQTCRIISETGDAELLEVLNNLKKYTDRKGLKKESPECKKLISIMEDRDKSSLGRLFYKNLSQLMMEAASEYDNEWSGRSNFYKARNAIIGEIEPLIIEMGFTGEFPHYRRISKNIGEYITFFSVNHGYRNFSNTDKRGSECVRLSILVGRAPLTILASDIFLSGLPFEKTNAWDCTWEKQKCRSAYIGPSDEEGWFEFSCDNGGILSEADIRRKAKEILPYMEVVNCTLRNKPLPEFYLKHHREYLKRNKTAKKLMGIIIMGGLFFGLSMWVLFSIIFPLILNGGTKKGFDIGTLFQALGCGALFGIVMGIYILYDIRRRAWPS